MRELGPAMNDGAERNARPGCTFLRGVGQRPKAATFPSRIFPSAHLPTDRMPCASLCVAIGDQVLDLAAAAELALLDDVDDSHYEVCQESCSEFADGPRPGALAQRCVALSSASGVRTRRIARKPHRACAGSRTLRWFAGGDRRLHRLLRLDASRQQRRCALSSGESAAAELQVGAHRISWPRFHHRVSGTGVRRPWGQQKQPASEQPLFAPSRRLDYEVEVGAFIGVGNEMGEAIPIAQARRSHLRALPGERLVGARHSILGVSAAWPVPRQEFCHQRYRPGSSPPTRLRRFAFRLLRGHRAIHNRCRTFQTRTTRRGEAST